MSFEHAPRVLGAAIVVGAIITIGISNVFTALGVEEVDRAQVDARRIAETVEVVEHRPGSAISLNFEKSYNGVQLSSDEIMIEHDGESVSETLHLNGDASGSLSDASSACIMNPAGGPVTIAEDCETVDAETLDAQAPPDYDTDSATDPDNGGTDSWLARLYKQEGLSGESVEITENEVVLRDLDGLWQNNVLSLEAASATMIELTQQRNLGGRNITVAGQAETLRLGDRIASIAFTPANAACSATLYPKAYEREGGLPDPGMKMTVGGESSNINGFGGDVRSAELLDPADGCSAELYEEEELSGACVAIGASPGETDCGQGSTPDQSVADVEAQLDQNSNFDGGVSSIRVDGGEQCRLRIYKQPDMSADQHLTLSGETETLHWPQQGGTFQSDPGGVSAVTVADGCKATVYDDAGLNNRLATLVGKSTGLHLAQKDPPEGGIRALRVTGFNER